MDSEKIKQYDEIVGVIMSNVIVEEQRNKRIVIWDFHPNNKTEQLYFNAAAVVSDIYKVPIYVQTSLWSYIKLRFHFRKRKNLRYLTQRAVKKVDQELITPAYIIMDFIREHYKIEESVFWDINKEYYGW